MITVDSNEYSIDSKSIYIIHFILLIYIILLSSMHELISQHGVGQSLGQ